MAISSSCPLMVSAPYYPAPTMSLQMQRYMCHNTQKTIIHLQKNSRNSWGEALGLRLSWRDGGAEEKGHPYQEWLHWGESRGGSFHQNLVSSEQREVSPNKHGLDAERWNTTLQAPARAGGARDSQTHILPSNFEMKLKKRKRKWIGPTPIPNELFKTQHPVYINQNSQELKRQVVSLNCEDRRKKKLCLHLWAQVVQWPSQPAAKRGGNKDHGMEGTANVTH